MGWFSKEPDETITHKTPCNTKDNPDGTPWWTGKKNAMGWGNDNPRTIKKSGQSVWDSGNHPRTHGSKAMWLFR